jgi:PAS domain S-box-containing protein
MRAHDHVHLRVALFVAAWAVLALHWFSWGAFAFETALAGAVLFSALRREALLRNVDGKRVQLELVTAVAAATTDASDVEELLERATAEICRRSEWPYGQVWLPGDNGGLRLARVWHGLDEERFRELREASLAVAFQPGDGLPGRVLASRAAASATADELSRGTNIGIRVGFAFPVLADGNVAAILEFFSSETPPRVDALVEAHRHLGEQLGQVVKRTHAEAQMRDTEERLRSLIETLPLATYIDRPGAEAGTTWVSPQMADITSYEASEWAADPLLFRKVLHPDDRERVVAELARVKESGEPLDHEYRMIRRDGTVVWLHDLAVTMSIDGTPFTRGFIVDVTARRDAESQRDESLEQLQAQNSELREVDRLKDEFVALVSHELRTPLTSIRGYLELMSEDTNLTDEQGRFMETIDRNAVRLQRVVGDLLFLAQVEAGKLTLEHEQVDVNTVVADALLAAHPAAASKTVELRSETAQLPWISADRARLAQVIDNFVSNAIKFTPGGGSVVVTTSATATAVRVEISDTGVGISADELPRLFERFFRTQSATTQAVPGTGLGLAIAKAIVEALAGEVTVFSEEGAGTTFRFDLPIVSP